MPNLQNGSKVDSNLGSLGCESSILPLSHRTPQNLHIFAKNLPTGSVLIAICYRHSTALYTAMKTRARTQDPPGKGLS